MIYLLVYDVFLCLTYLQDITHAIRNTIMHNIDVCLFTSHRTSNTINGRVIIMINQFRMIMLWLIIKLMGL